jgi:hypothetical protein
LLDLLKRQEDRHARGLADRAGKASKSAAGKDTKAKPTKAKKK